MSGPDRRRGHHLDTLMRIAVGLLRLLFLIAPASLAQPTLDTALG